MKLVKKMVGMGLLMVLLLSLVACKTNDKPDKPANDQVNDTNNQETDKKLSIDSIKLGEDYKDVKATIKVLTHRTDLVDTVFADYIVEFNKLYPDIKVEYEAVTDYAEDVTTRLTTDKWGDICMIPTTVDKDELANLFLSFGKLDTLEKKYIMLNNFSFENNVYGIPSTGNAQGVVYNKKVFEAAGLTQIPKTPEEFLTGLQKIKENTDAIPMYTNFAAGWTMSAWDAYIGGSATGDPDFMNDGLVHGKNPFAKRDDMTGPYAVYNILYEATARGLIEEDPTTTDWEASKGMINNGEIATMVLGSWAVTQMQEAGDNGADIGYMPFPISINGKQYASAGPDYCYGINVNISDDNKIASMLYVKWLTEESNFSFDQGGIPIVIGAQYPSVLDSFEGVELIIDNPAKAGEETYFNDINNESELSLNADSYHVNQILEHALQGDKTLDEIVEDWNQRWSDAQEKYEISVR